MSFFPKGVYVNSQEGRCKSARFSHHCEAAFRHVTQRVQELADALHEEQRKHLDALRLDVCWDMLGPFLMDKEMMMLQNFHEMQCFNHSKVEFGTSTELKSPC